jgi:hypothetical protein
MNDGYNYDMQQLLFVKNAKLQPKKYFRRLAADDQENSLILIQKGHKYCIIFTDDQLRKRRKEL